MRLALLLFSAALCIAVFNQGVDANRNRRSMDRCLSRMRSSMSKLRSLSSSRNRRVAAMSGSRARSNWARSMRVRRVTRAARNYQITRVSRRVTVRRFGARKVQRYGAYSRATCRALVRRVAKRSSYSICKQSSPRFVSCTRRLYMRCPKGYSLRGNMAMRVYCPKPYIRRGATCVRYRRVVARRMACPRGFTRYGSRCVQRLSLTCAAGYRVYKGRCHLVKCPTGYSKIGNSCRKSCRQGFTMRGSMCVRVRYRCPRNFYLQGDQCVRYRSGFARCRSGYHRKGDKCIRTLKSCPLNYKLQGKRCVLTCPSGRIPRRSRDGRVRCVVIISRCPVGYKMKRIKTRQGFRIQCTMNGGSCVNGFRKVRRYKRGYACVRIACPKNYAKRGSSCVYRFRMRRRCPTGYTLNGATCQRLRCPDGYIRRGSRCTYARCPNGYKRAGRMCVRTRFVGSCPSGWARHGRLCRRLLCPAGYRKVGQYCMNNSCPPGFVRRRGMCVRTHCTPGYKKIGKLCIRDCPAGTKTSGRFCVKMRCPKRFKRVGKSCVRAQCPKGYTKRTIRKKVYVGRKVSGSEKKCSCIGTKTDKKPSKKNSIDMAFVVDVTGSMGSVISAIKAKISEVINANSESHVVDKFVLVPFGDPNVGPVTVTQARTKSAVVTLLRALNSMRASGGGDCPEFSHSGMYEALTRVKDNSIVYVFTDASASSRDRRKENDVRALAERKNVQLNFLLSGNLCGQHDSYRSLSQSARGAWIKMSSSQASRVMSFVSRALSHGAAELRGMNRDSLSTFVSKREKCTCRNVPRVTAKYSYVNAVTCLKKSSGGTSKRCPRGFSLTKGRCVKHSSSLRRCPPGFSMQTRREKVVAGKRAVGGFVKTCKCLDGKPPSTIIKRVMDMAFVVDVSGSMSRVISGIKNKIREVIDANSHYGVVDNFVLVPFGDPVVGPRIVSRANDLRSRQELLDAVNRMRAAGGGDCPEMSRSGMYQAASVLKPGSIMYVFTDASASIRDKVTELALAKLISSRNIQVNFLISGHLCGQRTAYKALASSSSGSWTKMSNSMSDRVLSFISRAMAHGASGMRQLNRSGLATFLRHHNRCRCTRSRRTVETYKYVTVRRCMRRSDSRTDSGSSGGSRGRRRCPPGFRLERAARDGSIRCIRKTAARCAAGMKRAGRKCVKSCPAGTKANGSDCVRVRCSRHFRLYGDKCIRVHCPRNMKTRRVRSRVQVGTRVSGYTKKCSCIGTKTDKKPSKKNSIDMAFVVDVTGSMGSVISAIKAKISEVINANSESHVVDKFVLVPFGDPNVGPVTVTQARTKSAVVTLLGALNSMRASGGGDCPEFSHSGMYEALTRVKDNSIVYVFTDASASSRDRRKENDVRALAERKNVQLNFLLSGNLCGQHDSYRSLSQSAKGAWIKISSSQASRVMSFVSRALSHGAAELRGMNRDSLSTFVSKREKCTCRNVPRVTAQYSYVDSVTCTRRSVGRCRRGYRLVRGKCVRSTKRCGRGYRLVKGKCVRSASRCGRGYRLLKGKCVAAEVGVSCGAFRCTGGMSCLKKYRYSAPVRAAASKAHSARLASAARWYNARRAAEARRHQVFIRSFAARFSAIRLSRFCEHQTGTLSCPRGTTIDIVKGFYGRMSNKLCNRGPIRTTSCSAGSANSRIKNTCQNRQWCRVSASNSAFGDPCVGTIKYVEVQFKCRASRATESAKTAENARYAAALRALTNSYNLMKAKYNESLKRVQSMVSRCAFSAPRADACKAVRCDQGTKCAVRRQSFAGKMAYKAVCVRVPSEVLCARISCGRGRRCVVISTKQRIGRGVKVVKSAKCQPKKDLCSTKRCSSGSRCRVVYRFRKVVRRVRRRQRRCSCKKAGSKPAKAAARGGSVDMAFVIDTTGSMGRVIRSIQTNIIEIVRASKGTVSRFVVAPFNDPKAGPLTVSTSAKPIVSAIKRLRASGGGDCPEMAMHGILEAANKVNRGSVIYVFTDASAKDYGLLKKVRNVVDRKDLQMVFIVTGRLCGSSYHNEYQALAKGNGRVVTLHSRNIDKVLSFIRRAVAFGSSRLRSMNVSDLSSYVGKCKCRKVTRVIKKTYRQYYRVATCTRRSPGDCSSRKCSKGFKCVTIRTQSLLSKAITRCVRSSNPCNNVKCSVGFTCKVRHYGRVYVRGGRRYRLVRFKAACVRVNNDLCARVRCGRFRRCVVANRFSQAYRTQSAKRYKLMLARRAAELKKRKASFERRFAARLKGLTQRGSKRDRKSVDKLKKRLNQQRKSYLAVLDRLYKRSLAQLRTAFNRSKTMTVRCVGPKTEKNPCSRVKCRLGKTCTSKVSRSGRMTSRCVKTKNLCSTKKCPKGTRCVISSAVTSDGRKYRETRRRQGQKYVKARHALRSRYTATYRATKSTLRSAKKSFRRAIVTAKKSKRASTIRALKTSWRSQQKRLRASLRQLTSRYILATRALRAAYKRNLLKVSKTYKKRQLVKKFAQCRADPCARAKCKSGYRCSVVRRYTKKFASYVQHRRLVMQAFFKKVRSLRKAPTKKSRGRRVSYQEYRKMASKAGKSLSQNLKALRKKYGESTFKNRVKEVARCIPRPQRTCLHKKCGAGTRCVVRSVPTWWYKLYRKSVKRAYLRFKTRLQTVVARLSRQGRSSRQKLSRRVRSKERRGGRRLRSKGRRGGRRVRSKGRRGGRRLRSKGRRGGRRVRSKGRRGGRRLRSKGRRGGRRLRSKGRRGGRRLRSKGRRGGRRVRSKGKRGGRRVRSKGRRGGRRVRSKGRRGGRRVRSKGRRGGRRLRSKGRRGGRRLRSKGRRGGRRVRSKGKRGGRRVRSKGRRGGRRVRSKGRRGGRRVRSKGKRGGRRVRSKGRRGGRRVRSKGKRGGRRVRSKGRRGGRRLRSKGRRGGSQQKSKVNKRASRRIKTAKSRLWGRFKKAVKRYRKKFRASQSKISARRWKKYSHSSQKVRASAFRRIRSEAQKYARRVNKLKGWFSRRIEIYKKRMEAVRKMSGAKRVKARAGLLRFYQRTMKLYRERLTVATKKYYKQRSRMLKKLEKRLSRARGKTRDLRKRRFVRRAICMPINPCSAKRCHQGFVCRVRRVRSGRNPRFKKIARCERYDPCKNIKCSRSSRCVVRRTATKELQAYRWYARKSSRRHNKAVKSLRRNIRQRVRKIKRHAIRRYKRQVRTVRRRLSGRRFASRIGGLKQSLVRRLQRCNRRARRDYKRGKAALRRRLRRVLKRHFRRYLRHHRRYSVRAVCVAAEQDPCSKKRCPSGSRCIVRRQRAAQYKRFVATRRRYLRSYRMTRIHKTRRVRAAFRRKLQKLLLNYKKLGAFKFQLVAKCSKKAYCPRGYFRSGSQCVRYVEVCPESYVRIRRRRGYRCIRYYRVCPAGYMHFDNLCVKSCPPGTRRSSKRACKVVKSCSTFLNNTKCVRACPKNTIPVGRRCRRCPKAAIARDGKCLVPRINCRSGYQHGQQCVKSCPKGFYAFGSRCTRVRCPSGSKARFSHRRRRVLCIRKPSCKKGAVFYAGSCHAKCPTGTRQRGWFCLRQCRSGLVRVGFRRQRCIRPYCRNRFRLGRRGCVRKCPIGFVGVRRTCRRVRLTCPVGYARLGRALCLKDCPIGFAKRNGHCEYNACAKGTFRYRGTCMKSCPAGTIRRGRHCFRKSNCKFGRFDYSKLCLRKCPPGHYRSYSTRTCVRIKRCSSGMIRFRRLCLKSCPLGFEKARRTCKRRSTCRDGYAYKGACLPLGSNCPASTVLIRGSCVRAPGLCVSGRLLLIRSSGARSCVRLCPRGYMADKRRRTCTMSHCPSGTVRYRNTCRNTCPRGFRADSNRQCVKDKAVVKCTGKTFAFRRRCVSSCPAGFVLRALTRRRRTIRYCRRSNKCKKGKILIFTRHRVSRSRRYRYRSKCVDSKKACKTGYRLRRKVIRFMRLGRRVRRVLRICTPSRNNCAKGLFRYGGACRKDCPKGMKSVIVRRSSRMIRTCAPRCGKLYAIGMKCVRKCPDGFRATKFSRIRFCKRTCKKGEFSFRRSCVRRCPRGYRLRKLRIYSERFKRVISRISCQQQRCRRGYRLVYQLQRSGNALALKLRGICQRIKAKTCRHPKALFYGRCRSACPAGYYRRTRNVRGRRYGFCLPTRKTVLCRSRRCKADQICVVHRRSRIFRSKKGAFRRAIHRTACVPRYCKAGTYRYKNKCIKSCPRGYSMKTYKRTRVFKGRKHSVTLRRCTRKACKYPQARYSGRCVKTCPKSYMMKVFSIRFRYRKTSYVRRYAVCREDLCTKVRCSSGEKCIVNKVMAGRRRTKQVAACVKNQVDPCSRMTCRRGYKCKSASDRSGSKRARCVRIAPNCRGGLVIFRRRCRRRCPKRYRIISKRVGETLQRICVRDACSKGRYFLFDRCTSRCPIGMKSRQKLYTKTYSFKYCQPKHCKGRRFRIGRRCVKSCPAGYRRRYYRTRRGLSRYCLSYVCKKGYYKLGRRCVRRCGKNYRLRTYTRGEHTFGVCEPVECGKSFVFVAGKCRPALKGCYDRVYSCRAMARRKRCSSKLVSYLCPVACKKCKPSKRKFCTCTSSGDPHYRTFDGKWITFQGKCKYLLAQSTLKKGSKCNFEVTAKNEVRGKAKTVTWTRFVEISFHGIKIRLHQRRRVFVNGKRIRRLPISFYPDGKKIRIYHSGRNVVAESKYCGMHLQFNGKSIAELHLPRSRYAGKVQGICGNCNGDPKDDLKTRDGKDVSKLGAQGYAKIGQSFAVPDDSSKKYRCEVRAVPPANKICSSAMMKKVATNEYCGLILDKSGPFSQCINSKKVDFAGIFKNCQFDVCEYKSPRNRRRAVCQSLESLYNACLAAGFSVKWRSRSFCPMRCGPNAVYSQKASACPRTCSDIGRRRVCRLPDRDACVCKPGFVLNGRTCVPEKSCGDVVPIDVAFVVEGTDDISTDEFEALKSLVVKLLTKYRLSLESVRPSLVVFGRISPTVSLFSEHQDKTEFMEFVRKLKKTGGSTDNLEAALRVVNKVLMQAIGGFRPEVPKYVIVLKKSSVPATSDKPVRKQLEKLKELKVRVVVVNLPKTGKSSVDATMSGLTIIQAGMPPFTSIPAISKELESTAGCPLGFRMEKDGCVDVNECTASVPACHSDATCVNLPGSFVCLCGDGLLHDRARGCVTPEKPKASCPEEPKCDKGFYYDKTANKCMDIDECKENPCLGDQATCVNLAGSFKCGCPAGFEYNKFFGCVDIDECKVKKDPCMGAGKCINMLGSYNCSCDSGYLYKSGVGCEDIDECASNSTNTCKGGSKCVNTAGSFNCSCAKGYRYSSESCVDIDECAENSKLCDASAMCVNQKPGYKCQCKLGDNWMYKAGEGCVPDESKGMTERKVDFFFLIDVSDKLKDSIRDIQGFINGLLQQFNTKEVAGLSARVTVVLMGKKGEASVALSQSPLVGIAEKVNALTPLGGDTNLLQGMKMVAEERKKARRDSTVVVFLITASSIQAGDGSLTEIRRYSDDFKSTGKFFTVQISPSGNPAEWSTLYTSAEISLFVTVIRSSEMLTIYKLFYLRVYPLITCPAGFVKNDGLCQLQTATVKYCKTDTGELRPVGTTWQEECSQFKCTDSGVEVLFRKCLGYDGLCYSTEEYFPCTQVTGSLNWKCRCRLNSVTDKVTRKSFQSLSYQSIAAANETMMTDKGIACVFPFKYQNKWHYSCDLYEGRYWCSFHRYHETGSWGYCKIKASTNRCTDPFDSSKIYVEGDRWNHGCNVMECTHTGLRRIPKCEASDKTCKDLNTDSYSCRIGDKQHSNCLCVQDSSGWGKNEIVSGDKATVITGSGGAVVSMCVDISSGKKYEQGQEWTTSCFTYKCTATGGQLLQAKCQQKDGTCRNIGDKGFDCMISDKARANCECSKDSSGNPMLVATFEGRLITEVYKKTEVSTSLAMIAKSAKKTITSEVSSSSSSSAGTSK